jgi:hypothetical protein
MSLLSVFSFALMLLCKHHQLVPPREMRDILWSRQRAPFQNHIAVSVRESKGRDIDGACGQLRKSYLDQEKGEIEC